jgi:hypothetical protein
MKKLYLTKRTQALIFCWHIGIQIYIEVNICQNFDGKLPPICLMPLCSGQLDILNKINRAEFFLNRHEVKFPITAHVKLQKLMLRAESKLHAIFSADFISLHQGLLGKKKL